MTEPAPARVTEAQRVPVASDRTPMSPIGRRRVDHTLSLMMAAFGALFCLEGLPALLGQWRFTATPVGLLEVVLIAGTILVVGVAVALKAWVRPMFVAAGAVYLLAVLLWPAAVARPLPEQGMPWLLGEATVFCGYVILAFRSPWVPAGYAVLVATLVGSARAEPFGGDASPVTASIDGLSVLALALALLAVITAVRTAARSVDRAQGAALGRYSDAQVDEAMESERVRTDALVHDSVLTTFLSAAAAQTPEARRLAARMALNSMGVLTRATVASHSGPKVSLGDVLTRTREDAEGIAQLFEFSMNGARGQSLPEKVADSVVLAVVQAMTNSVKHAGDGVARSVAVTGTGTGGVRVTVSDSGRGFAMSGIASERLGVRVSIIERMRRIGGEAEIESAPGRGTTIRLVWPASSQSVQVAPPVEEVLA